MIKVWEPTKIQIIDKNKWKEVADELKTDGKCCLIIVNHLNYESSFNHISFPIIVAVELINIRIILLL